MKSAILLMLLVLSWELKSQDAKLVLPIANKAGAGDIQISPDGQTMLCSTTDDVKVWDIRMKKLKYGLSGNTVPFLSCRNVFNKDGNKFLTIANQNKICVWNVPDGRLLLEIAGDGKYVSSAMFANNSQEIVASYQDGGIVIWDGLTGQEKSIVTGKAGEIGGVTLSRDDSLIIEEVYPGIRIYRRNDLKQVWTFEIPRSRASTFKDVFISNGNERLIAVTWDSALYVWDLPNTARLPVLRGKYSDMSVSTDGNTIAVIEAEILKIFKNDLVKPVASRKVQWDTRIDINSDGTGLLVTDGLYSNAMSTVSFYGILDALPKYNFQVESVVNKPQFTGNKEFIIADGRDKYGKHIKLFRYNDGKFYGSLNHEISHYIIDMVPIGETGLMVTSSTDSIVRVWRTSGAEIASVYSSSTYHGFSSVSHKYAIDIKSAVEYGNSDTVIIRDAATGRLIRSLVTHTEDASKSFVSPDDKYLVLNSFALGPTVFDFQSGKKICSFEGLINDIDNIQFIPQISKIATTSYLIGSVIQIWDIKTGSLYFTIDYPSKGVYDRWINEFSVSPDGKFLATASMDKYLKVWNLATKTLSKSVIGKEPFYSCAFSPDLRNLSAGMKDGSLVVVDMSNLSVKRSMKPHESMIYKVAYTDDSKFMITASLDGTLKIWDMVRMEVVRTVKSGGATFKCIQNGKIYCVENAEVSVFDFKSGEALYSFASLFEKGSVVLLPDKYYKATPDVARYLSWRKGAMLYGFEQFDIQYNRPDIVLERVGNGDTSLRASYRRAYEKRLKKLSIDSSSFSSVFNVPEAEIINREEIAYDQASGSLKLVIRAKDTVNKLDRFNIWANEVPIFGSKGISLGDRQINVFDTVVNIQLSDSINTVESSVVNARHIESFRRSLEVRYLPKHATNEKTYFIGIGINKFAEKGHDLSWSVKDIRDLANGFKNRIGNFLILDTLFDEKVDLESVRRLRKLLMNTDINDRVIIAYSGHGLLSRDYDYYLSTHQTEFDQPEKSSIPYELMEDLLDGIPARRKLLLIDACHSGEVDKEELVKMKQVYGRLNPGQKGGVVLVDSSNRKMGMKSSFELMQQVFVNVGRGTGATVISAAGGMQFALEKGELRNGVFTYSILEALEKYQTIKVSALGKIVGDRVEELTSGMQRPTSRREVITADWNVW